MALAAERRLRRPAALLRGLLGAVQRSVQGDASAAALIAGPPPLEVLEALLASPPEATTSTEGRRPRDDLATPHQAVRVPRAAAPSATGRPAGDLVAAARAAAAGRDSATRGAGIGGTGDRTGSSSSGTGAQSRALPLGQRRDAMRLALVDTARPAAAAPAASSGQGASGAARPAASALAEVARLALETRGVQRGDAPGPEAAQGQGTPTRLATRQEAAWFPDETAAPPRTPLGDLEPLPGRHRSGPTAAAVGDGAPLAASLPGRSAPAPLATPSLTHAISPPSRPADGGRVVADTAAATTAFAQHPVDRTSIPAPRRPQPPRLLLGDDDTALAEAAWRNGMIAP